MKVILLNDVKNQGKKDNVIDVKNGYATYLINNKLAVKFSKTSSNILNNEIKDRNDLEQENINQSEKIKSRIEKEKIVFFKTCGSNGKLFGSISTKQISEKLNDLGYKIDKKKIKINEEITTLGFYDIEIILHSKVKAKVKIEVVKE